MADGGVVEIWGRLDYVGLDAEGKIHIIIEKSDPDANSRCIRESREFVGEKIRITMRRLPW